MLLRVKNLGPVREAELDLGKPLIVLTGPNNSGKTYLAWAAYSLAKLRGDTVEPPAGVRVLAEQLRNAPSPGPTRDELLAVRGDVLRATERALHEQLPSDFAAARAQFDTTRFELVVPEPNREHFKPGNIYMVPHTSAKYGVTLIHAFHLDGERLRWIDSNVDSARDAEGLESCLTSIFLGFLLDRAYVAFPVERLAINLFARELAAKRTELVDDLLADASADAPSSALHEKLNRRASRYPLVIRDALQAAIRLSASANVGPLADLADEIEENILGGRFELDARDDVRFVPRQDPDKKPLGLHESASVVKSLVSLVLHLRYDAQPGQRLVIDEPELNLHPDNQRLVARILAKAVNRGLKIMMSTHSDYVIRELNNLVMLGQDSDTARALVRDLGYQPDETLRPDQIGAYLVNDGACTRLEVTETGFETKTIEDEIHKLNQDAQTIYLRLFCD